MELDLSILYRGPLSSCNYDCDYCPFAKHHETAAELKVDRQALERFESWCASQQTLRLSILFTPWGEALTRRWYRDAICRLSHQPHLRKVAIQTNLSCQLDWLKQCDLERVGLWCTFHPEQVALDQFVDQCHRLDAIGAKYSVGVVGRKEHWEAAQALRTQLRPEIYMWVNAFKDQPSYYEDAEIAQWTALDPLFPINNRRHPSLGKSCRAGQTVISVDGEGTVRRCHFIKTKLGNLYEDSLETMLAPRRCTNAVCGCHIGYVHLEELQLYEVFGDGVLERRPEYGKRSPTIA
ncbi:MAG: STM4011 family radical SAM protein [Aureliella sp.]